MKQFANYRNKKDVLTETVGDPPTILVLKRKYIRMFPGNVKVAVYYSDKLKKYITVPYEDIQFSMEEETKKSIKPQESNMEILQNIVMTNKPDTIEFTNNTKCEVSVDEANAILNIYARCHDDNQKKIDDCLLKSVGGFRKLANFAIFNQ